jgi:hypothetical protein
VRIRAVPHGSPWGTPTESNQIEELRLTVPSAARCGALLSLVALFAFSVSAAESADEANTREDASWERDAQPVLEQRCAVCHGCYDAPCQLVLTSHEGMIRGASKSPVYRPERLVARQPTRLFVDARTPSEWRARGFFPVVDAPRDGEEPTALLHRMLRLGRAHPPPPDRALPARFDVDLDRTLSCPNEAEFDSYALQRPQGGMPWGMAPLSDDEYAALERWLGAGAPGPAPTPPDPAAEERIATVEDFLNATSPRRRLVSRYLYEHLFLADLYFEDLPPGRFYRLVRSRTPSGRPIDEIATVRPYDPPGGAFHYRLRAIDGAVARKNHIVYALGTEKLARLRELFLDPSWSVRAAPGYDVETAANPFLAFAAIPARARYQFLLDDAEYFIRTFIRGPVCRGQVALDVIQDHFFITFLDPDFDLSVGDSKFLATAAPHLRLPGERASGIELRDLWETNFSAREKYRRLRNRAYADADPEKRGLPLAAIWDGDGRERAGRLTVFRHFNSASVVAGFVGEIPKSAWVVDFPIFERIYYDLVAEFDVFGNLRHQVSTRFYMDYLRIEAEDGFLAFLPVDRREAVRRSWYRGPRAQMKMFLRNRLFGLDRGTRVAFATDDPKRELLEKIHAAGAGARPDRLNRCAKPPCDRPDASPSERAVERSLQRVASRRGAHVRTLPDVAYLVVHGDDDRRPLLLYTLIRNKDHSNVAFLFGEELRRRPEHDSVSVVRGPLGNYPNFFFQVARSEVDAFVDALLALHDERSFEHLVNRYGVRRSHPDIWRISDWINAESKAQRPLEAGILDLSRYENH